VKLEKVNWNIGIERACKVIFATIKNQSFAMKKNTCFAPGVTLGVPFFTEAKAISSGSLH